MKLRSWGLKVREWFGKEIEKFKELEGKKMREINFVFDGNSLILIKVKQDGVETVVTPGELFNGVWVIEDLRNQVLNAPDESFVDEVKEVVEEKGEPVMSSTNPFGTFQSDVGLPKAPTKEEVAKNPGAYDGTPFDPMAISVSMNEVKKFATAGPGYEVIEGEPYYKFSAGTLPDWYKIDQQAALGWYEFTNGFPLNVNALTANQKAKMGINVKEVLK
jgi:hypothetical protein